MRVNHRLLLQILNSRLHDYVAAATAEDLQQLGRRLGLLESELKFLRTVQSELALDDSADFADVASRAAVVHHVQYPFEVFLDPVLDQSKSEAVLAEKLIGKRVVVVGPSKSMVGSAQGATIESYDVVVRLNFQWPVPNSLVDDFGARIDVLYHTCNGDFPVDSLLLPEFSQIGVVCYERNIDARKLKTFCDSHQVASIDVTSVYQELSQSLGAPSPTGLVAIEHLSRFPLAELWITGFTLFRDGYYQEYLSTGTASDSGRLPRTEPGWKHQMLSQVRYLQQKISADGRLKVDRQLSQILSCYQKVA